MSIRSVLRHRAFVRRNLAGSWSTVASDVAVLLDAANRQSEPSYTAEQQRTADRSGALFSLSDSGIRPGDRVHLTRGGSGTFLVMPDPSQIFNLNGPSHSEFRVEEVASNA